MSNYDERKFGHTGRNWGQRYEPTGSSDPNDALEPVPPMFPDKEYMIPVSDHKGRSSRVEARILPPIARELEEIVHSHLYPFKTVSDVVRWCIWSGVRQLAERDHRRGFIGEANVLIGILQDKQYRETFSEVLNELEESVQFHIKQQRQEDAREIVRSAIGRFSRIEENWAGMLVQEVKQKYAYLLQVR